MKCGAKKSSFVVFLTALTILIVIGPSFVLAQTGYLTNPPAAGGGVNPPATGYRTNPPAAGYGTNSSALQGLQNPLGQNTTIYSLLDSIVGWLITLGGAIAVLMIIIGAFQMLFSGGDPERFKRGRQTILYTVIGYGIIILAKSITSLIQYMLNVS
ncbi:MAG: pilin [Candidatus Jorgensenbacteria bacterium]|nr:pilin [Candidatus Jorgensenbacteria bacterium]